MSTSDPRTPPDDAAPAPAWGTAPGAAGEREPAPSAPGPAEPSPPADGGERPAPGDPEPAPTAQPARVRRPGTGVLVTACLGVLLVGAVLVTEAMTARWGWAHVGWLYPVAGAVVLTVGAVAWRRGTRGVPGATRALVALLAGTVVVTTWVAVDVVPAAGPGYGVGSSLRGYPLGGGSDDGPEITAVSDRVWFGDSVRYADGLVVSVSAPQAYTPSEHAAVRDGDPPDSVRVRVRLTNGTGRAVDPGSIDVQPVSGGLVARRVYDYAPDVLLERPDLVARGSSGEWDLVYAVHDPEDVTVALEPTWANYAVAVFSW
ncbi:hypothetical protein ACH473_16165 [Cellulosimicrobium funkei]|uniref:hypothetical protein n=1 Tax=Cellulosimicrobium TaxID=157920 RepID=UPI0004E30D04|nr:MULTISPECIES: hypothetical protein [unclassified Cellulosimicrobium]ARK05025.1 hypothetical protein B8281_10050 [Cellulosimicrobium sp. TH-20]KFD43318.1 hypothetical protein IU11_12420 [Cellulosimicrobium sp. MM]